MPEYMYDIYDIIKCTDVIQHLFLYDIYIYIITMYIYLWYDLLYVVTHVFYLFIHM